MTDFPEIAILIITFNRPDEIRQTINALMEHVTYPPDKLHVIVSDDSTGGRYLSDLKRNKAYKEWGLTTIETPQRSGWGKHVNWALKHIRTKYPDVKHIFQIEDDYVLTHPLDLRLGVALLETKPHIGMVRYRGTAGMHTVFHQFEADIRDYVPDYDESSGQIQGRLCYLQLDSGSHGAYLYSNGPHLKRADWHETAYGYYPENKKMGNLEESYALHCKDVMKQDGSLGIVVLPDFVTMKFEHIGKTWQLSEHDI